MNIRNELNKEKLDYLDNIAQIVARLYEDGMTAEKLGEEPDELREAVYSLGQAYMVLYQEMLSREVVGEECPRCDNGGWYVVTNIHTGEPEQIQCEFCCTNPNSLFHVNRGG